MKKNIWLILCVLILTSCTSNSSFAPNESEFLEFFIDSNFSSSVVQETQDVEQWNSDTSRPFLIDQLLPDVCAYYQDQNGIEANYEYEFDGATRYFRPNEIKSVSQDLLGFTIQLLDKSVDESSENAKIYEVRNTYTDADLLADKPSGIIIGTPNTESYSYDGNVITIEADLFFKEPDTLTEYNCTMKYEFYYMPENSYIPYRFVSCQMVKGFFPS